MNPYVLIAGFLMALAMLGGTFRLGVKYERGQQAEAKVKEVEKIVYRDRVIEKEVPKIVTKVVEKRVEVEKEVERVVTKIPDLVAADCVLPDNFGFLLVAAANGIDPASARGTDALRGAYGCREVLEATLRDLEAGYVNSERLAGLQRWVEVVTEAKSAP